MQSKTSCCRRIPRCALAATCAAPTIPSQSAIHSRATRRRTSLRSRDSDFRSGIPGYCAAFARGCAPASCSRCSGATSNWRRRFVQVQRNVVRGILTTPKNHQRRRVDLSHQLTATLRLWRRQQRAAWFAVGRPFPEWVFSSVTGTALDESNVRKAFNRILDGAGVHRRGPHQMRHTFARCCCRKARRSPT